MPHNNLIVKITFLKFFIKRVRIKKEINMIFFLKTKCTAY